MGQLYLLLAAACWGISIPISTMLLKEVSPYQMMTLQLLGSNLFLAALVLFNKLDMESIASIFKRKKLAHRMVKCICITPNTVFPAKAGIQLSYNKLAGPPPKPVLAKAGAGVTGMGV